MPARRRENLPTTIVRRAQQLYPERLKGAVEYIGTPQYGQKLVDRKTADNQLVRMLPEQLQQLAMTDPQKYQQSMDRLTTLRENHAPLPGGGGYEGDL